MKHRPNANAARFLSGKPSQQLAADTAGHGAAYAAKLATLRARLQPGIDASERGEYVENFSMRELIAEIDREG